MMVVMVLLHGGAPVGADPGMGATTTDAFAKERADEFKELAKAKKKTLKGAERQLEIFQELERAPCRTAQRFLFDVVKRKASAGDHRLYALRALLKMTDAKTLGKLVGVLVKADDPALWSMFSAGLRHEPSDAVKAWHVQEGLASKQSAVSCACLRGLTPAQAAAQVAELGALYTKHQADEADVDIAYQALRALARSKHADARAALASASAHAGWKLRLAAADALPTLEPFDKDAETAVRLLLQDAHPAVQRAAIVGAGAGKRLGLAEALIGLLAGSASARTRDVSARALAVLSGKQLGHDPAAWAAWLAKKDPGKPQDLALPTYHGVPVASDHVLFLVDASGSMTWPWRKEPKRHEVAASQLEISLRKLPETALFNVIVFNEKALVWRKTAVAAKSENVSAAVRWARKPLAKPEGDTFLYEALARAYELDGDYDTFFLLTDGNPTAGRYYTREGLLGSIRGWNRYRRVAIHTIGLSLANMDRGMPNLSENLHVMALLMRAIAAATGGTFREVLRPPK